MPRERKFELPAYSLAAEVWGAPGGRPILASHGWLDNAGHPNTARLRVTERFRRRDFGHMDIDITIDDPGAYAKPWTVTLPLLYQADTELLEYICNENNRYFEILPKK